MPHPRCPSQRLGRASRRALERTQHTALSLCCSAGHLVCRSIQVLRYRLSTGELHDQLQPAQQHWAAGPLCAAAARSCCSVAGLHMPSMRSARPIDRPLCATESQRGRPAGRAGCTASCRGRAAGCRGRRRQPEREILGLWRAQGRGQACWAGHAQRGQRPAQQSCRGGRASAAPCRPDSVHLHSLRS